MYQSINNSVEHEQTLLFKTEASKICTVNSPIAENSILLSYFVWMYSICVVYVYKHACEEEYICLCEHVESTSGGCLVFHSATLHIIPWGKVSH